MTKQRYTEIQWDINNLLENAVALHLENCNDNFLYIGHCDGLIQKWDIDTKRCLMQYNFNTGFQSFPDNNLRSTLL